MFKNIKIGSRLAIGYILIFLLLVSLTLFAIDRMSLLSEQTVKIYNHPLTVSNAVLRINANIIKMHRSMKDVTLARDIESIDESAQIVNELEQEVYDDFQIINERFLGEKEKYEKALAAFNAWKPIRDKVIALMIEGESLKAAEITGGKGARHVVKIEKAMEALGDFAQYKATDFLNTAELTRQLAFTTIYFLLVIATIVSVIFAFYITGTITKPLETVRAATDKLGKGNLNTKIEIDSNDEIGQLANSFNKMTSDLKSITASRDELDKEIAERKQAEEQVKKSLREKDILLKEIHHRVKNNMNVITSLLGLQSKYIHDEKAQIIFQESRNRINSMARIHEKLYRTDLTSIDVNAYIRTLANDLIGSYHVNAEDIKLSISAPEVSLGIDSMIPFGLILNELISNSLKYAFQDGQKGEIRVAISSNGSKHTLSVSDNGIGLPEGFDINNTETLGLLLVNSLVRQLNGTIEVDGTRGTALRITFTEQDRTEGEQT